MHMLDMVFGLHFYQPPTQRPEVLRIITDECYRPLLRAIGEAGCVVTADICASLLEQLAEHHPDVITLMHELVRGGYLSLVNTAAYHVILPLAPQHFAERQLRLNETWYRDCEFIEEHDMVPGVFPPEMAFAPEIIPFLQALEYQWAVVDDEPYVVLRDRNVPFDRILEQGGMKFLLRSRLWSNRISFHMPEGDGTARDMWRDMRQHVGNRPRGYLVIWMDAETFGHHHKGAIERFFLPFITVAKELPIRFVSPEELIRMYPPVPASIPSGSWSTDAGDLRAGIPFPLWFHPEERWHSLWWQLAYLAIGIADAHAELQGLCDKALYSCQPWWIRQPGRNKELFLWALPALRRIVAAGTEQERATGTQLIEHLVNF